MIKLYISGPMNEKPERNFPAFYAAEDALLKAGFATINPARNPLPEGSPSHGAGSREHYMRLYYQNVMRADGIALLDDHAYSPGAQSEIRMALDLGLPVAKVDWWIEHAARHARVGFFGAARAEMEAAQKIHAPMKSRHEAFGILLEAVEEFWSVVRKRNAEPNVVLSELVQIAAMAGRAANDLKLATSDAEGGAA